MNLINKLRGVANLEVEAISQPSTDRRSLLNEAADEIEHLIFLLKKVDENVRRCDLSMARDESGNFIDLDELIDEAINRYADNENK